MICVFRCDANQQIGLGHFVRCLSLANALFKRQAKCFFIMSSPGSSIQKALKDNHHQLLVVTHSTTLDQIDDIKQSKILIESKQIQPDLFIIDHYQLSAIWWNEFRKPKIKVFVLNDSKQLINNVDYIWQMAPFNKEEIQTHSEPIVFSGSKYALLREEFHQSTPVSPSKNLHDSILISIGATDPDNTAEFFIKNIGELLPNINLTLMTSSLNIHLPQLRENFSHKNIHFQIDPKNIVEVIQQHSLMITAAGTMMWEAFSLGTPVLLLKNHPNQQTNIDLITPSLAELYIGEEKNLTMVNIIKKINTLLKSTEKRLDIQEKMQKLCDGRGCDRVAKKLVDIHNNA